MHARGESARQLPGGFDTGCSPRGSLPGSTSFTTARQQTRSRALKRKPDGFDTDYSFVAVRLNHHRHGLLAQGLVVRLNQLRHGLLYVLSAQKQPLPEAALRGGHDFGRRAVFYDPAVF